MSRPVTLAGSDALLPGAVFALDRASGAGKYTIKSRSPEGRTLDPPSAVVQRARGGLLVLHGDDGSLFVVIEAPRRFAAGQKLHVGDHSGAGIGTVERPGAWREGERWIVRDITGTEIASASRVSRIPLFVRGMLLYLFLDLIPLPYAFSVRIDGRQIATFSRRRTFRRRYLLDLRADIEHELDQRLALALAIAMAEADYRVDQWTR